MSQGASQSRVKFGDQYNAWLRHHRLSAADSLFRVLDNFVSSVLTWLVIGIALALPVALDVALDNANELSAGWDSPSQISLFLADDIGADAARALAAELEARDDVVSVQFVSREDALAEFSELSGFADVLASLEENPLPNLLLVGPADDLGGAATGGLRSQLAELPGVAEAVLDMEWLQRLNSLMELSRRMVLAIGALLVLGVVLILGNTIRLAIEARRDEIVIVKLVGGSNPFVRRPFLYTGLWYGVGGGFFAGLLVSSSLWFLQQPVSSLAALYQSEFELAGLGFMGFLNLLVLGGLLGLAGAWLAVSRHLSKIEPR
ncbi:ABC transporter permease [Halioglobus maricola]|uniref:Cell division protein FtsX n=1 Tax=Halioglobus maricola TaxID=2601894 RepID=A0A5P9NPA5_9GAMM|nr:permease-like cell division protein FtsX [Halioglobus maricola]QFU77617.1 ABC transporter permease [Halioglobus maricola]